jgi:hypothetical protein
VWYFDFAQTVAAAGKNMLRVIEKVRSALWAVLYVLVVFICRVACLFKGRQVDSEGGRLYCNRCGKPLD